MSLRDKLTVSNTSKARWPSIDLSWNSTDPGILQVLSRYERDLWFLAIAAMLVDVTLTTHGLQLGLRELNPIARAAIDWIGILGLYGLKGVAILLGILCVSAIPERYTPLVPLGLAVPSMIAVLINTVVISTVVV